MQLNYFHPSSLLRIDDVEKLTSLSRSTIYRHVQRELFPVPLKLGQRCTRWRAGDVIAWLEAMRWNCLRDNSMKRPVAESCQIGKSAEARIARIAGMAIRGAPLHQLAMALPSAASATDPAVRVVEVADSDS